MGRLTITRVCKHCRISFRPFTRTAVYCSQSCYRAIERPRSPTAGTTTNCKKCGKAIFRNGKTRPAVHCSVACYRAPTTADRFWARVEKTETCWLWSGGRDPDGYGEFNGTRAHRASWELHNGPIPNGLWVLHHCDNPPCVRPDHLFLGSSADNTADKVAKGRHRLGADHGMAIVTEVQVKEIRERYRRGGISQTTLGAEYGLSQTSVSQIVLKKCWKHIE